MMAAKVRKKSELTQQFARFRIKYLAFQPIFRIFAA